MINTIQQFCKCNHGIGMHSDSKCTMISCKCHNYKLARILIKTDEIKIEITNNV